METQKIRTMFFGSGNFAIKILTGMMQQMPFLDVVAVVTQPDKPVGRNKTVMPSPLLRRLNEMQWDGIVAKPEKLGRKADQLLENIKPDFILVADYGQIIPTSIINYPKFKCLNVHGSLLPDLRGAVPAAMAILKGYQRTGVSIPVMTPGLDDGNIVASASIDILPDDTTQTLRMRLADVGVDLLQKTLPDWFTGKITAIPQDQSKATFTRQSDIAKEKAQITRDTPVVLAERMVRAFYPWPVAWIEVTIRGQNKRLKIFQVKKSDQVFPEKGRIYKQGKELYLNLNDGSLLLEQVQLEGKIIGTGKDYLFLNSVNIL